ADYELLQLTADAVFRKVHYDPVAARIWVETVRGQACQDTVAVATTLENAWDPVFVGTVGKGGPCLVDDECAGTSACDRSMCGNGPACCAGVCTPKPKHVPLGGDCSMDTCEDSAYCDTEGGGGGPPTATCKPRAGNGQPCQDQGGCVDGQLCGN